MRASPTLTLPQQSLWYIHIKPRYHHEPILSLPTYTCDLTMCHSSKPPRNQTLCQSMMCPQIEPSSQLIRILFSRWLFSSLWQCCRLLVLQPNQTIIIIETPHLQALFLSSLPFFLLPNFLPPKRCPPLLHPQFTSAFHVLSSSVSYNIFFVR